MKSDLSKQQDTSLIHEVSYEKFDSAAVGVWIDSKVAKIIQIKNGLVLIDVIESNLPGKHKSSGGTHSPIPYQQYSISSEYNEHHSRSELQKRYLKKVMGLLKGAVRIVIMGPGSTKKTLFNQIQESKGLAHRLDPEIITLGPLSDPELADFIKLYFRKKPSS